MLKKLKVQFRGCQGMASVLVSASGGGGNRKLECDTQSGARPDRHGAESAA